MEKRENILYILGCLSNYQFQIDCWKNGIYFDQYCSSFGEAVNSLDDFNFFDDIATCKFNFSEVLYSKVVNILSDLEQYQETENMLHDQYWIDIVKRIGQVHSELLSIEKW